MGPNQARDLQYIPLPMRISSLRLTLDRRSVAQHAAASALLILALLSASVPLQAQLPAVVTPTPVVLNFEPLSTSHGCDDNAFATYGGLAWTGWGAISKAECGSAEVGGPRNGYFHGATSGGNVGYIQLPPFADPFGALHADIAMGGGTFDLLDAWLTAAWTTGLDVTIDGFNGTTLIGTRTFRIDYTAPTHGVFGLMGLTRAHFRTSGGTPHFELGGLGNILVMDDLSVVRYDAVITPEPATLLLVTSGLVAVALARRRRR